MRSWWGDVPGLLVVAAYEPELAGLPAGVEHAAVGVGPVDAACGTAAALARFMPERVLLLGTCGAFAESGLAIGDVVVVKEAVLPDAAGAEWPAPVVRRAVGDAAFAAALGAALAAPRVRAACGGAVTVDAAAAARLHLETGAAVEHMECFAVYRACARAGVPVAAALAVANFVGPVARKEWQARAAEVERALVSRVTEALGLGVPPTRGPSRPG